MYDGSDPLRRSQDKHRTNKLAQSVDVNKLEQCHHDTVMFANRFEGLEPTFAAELVPKMSVSIR